MDDVRDAEGRTGASGAVSQAIKAETKSAVWEALDRLSPTDREVVLLRGIEQSPLRAVAASVQSTPEAVRKRYHRALAQLRSFVPRSVFAELPDGD